MAVKTYDNLTQDEVNRAELMSLRIMLALLLHRLMDQSQNPSALSAEIESAIAQLADQIPATTIEPSRQQAYKAFLVDRASVLLKQAKSIRRGAGHRPN